MTITDIDSVKQSSKERIRTLSGNPRNVLWNWYAQSLHFRPSTYKSPPKNLLSVTDGVTQILALTATGNWILIKLPQHILRCYMEFFRNNSGTIPEKPPKFDSGYNTEDIRIFLTFWRYFLYSDTFLLILPIQKTATLIKFKLLLNSKGEKFIQMYN